MSALVRGVASTLLACAALGCSGPTAPAHATWANVEPIIAGECAGCHGASAGVTVANYRFDFYDMTMASCGDAAQGLGADTPMAAAFADLIWQDISSDQPGTRPKMPPPPAPYLADWEWQTIRAWHDDGAPRGNAPPQNHPPQLRFSTSAAVADQSVDVTALVTDPDGDPVVGVLTLGDTVLRMPRSGSFSAHVDTSAWAAGSIAVTAALCDGWLNFSQQVGTLTIQHGP